MDIPFEQFLDHAMNLMTMFDDGFGGLDEAGRA